MNASHREQLITLGIPVVIMVLFFYLLIRPGRNTLQQLRSNQRELLLKRGAIENDYMNSVAAYKEVEELRDGLRRASRRIPEEDQFAEFENELWELHERLDLVDSVRRPYIEKPITRRGENVVTQSLRLNFRAPPLTFYEFLTEVETQERLVEVTRIEMAPGVPSDTFAIIVELNMYYGEL